MLTAIVDYNKMDFWAGIYKAVFSFRVNRIGSLLKFAVMFAINSTISNFTYFYTLKASLNSLKCLRKAEFFF